MTQKKNNKRAVGGILLVDKWLGVSSNHALQWTKRLYHAKKAGHTGSLDSLATGMLPVCFGPATKFCQFLLNADKTYQVCLRLGVATVTGDAEGRVVAKRSVPDMTAEQWQVLLQAFRGQVTQLPSMYSALKYQGKPLYDYARRGITVPRKERQVSIHELSCIYYNATHAILRVRCSKGTYIRTLVEDMGERLGCGAHVTWLRRTVVGDYQASQMVSWQTLSASYMESGWAGLDSYLLPISSMVTHLPAVRLKGAARYKLGCQGQCTQLDLPVDRGWVQLHSMDAGFCGVAEVVAGSQLKAICLLPQPERRQEPCLF